MKRSYSLGVLTGLMTLVLLAGPTMVAHADEKADSKDKPQAKAPQVKPTQPLKLQVDVGDGKVQTFSFPMNAGDKNAPAIIGKAIIIGPDGKKQEFDLPMNLGEFKIPEHFLKATASSSRYMIGLLCKPADGEVQKQLKLGDAGLEVMRVVEDTPAAAVDIKEGDVLVKADKKNLAELEDLMEAVQQAGKAERKLSLQLIREGKKMTVELTPIQQVAKGFPIVMPALEELQKQHPELKNLQKQLERMKLPHGIQFQGDSIRLHVDEIGPAAVITGAFEGRSDTEVQALKKQVENLSRQVRELKQAVAELKTNLDK